MNETPRKKILGFNIIKPGLNFLVPTQWWTDFTRMNQHVSDPNDIQLPDDHPLSWLLGAQILQLPNIHTELDKATFKIRTQNIGQGLAKSLQPLKQQTVTDDYSQFVEQALEVLENKEAQHIQMKVLLCPRVGQGIHLVDGFSWRIVTPYIYRAISSKTTFIINNQATKHIIGVPIFLDQYTELQGQTSKEYTLVQQVQTQIFVHLSQEVRYGVFGFLQRKRTYEGLMRDIYEGLNNLMGEEDLNNAYFFKKSLYAVNQHHFFQSFLPKDGLEIRKIRSLGNLKCWFGIFSGQVPSEKFEICQFICGIKAEQSSLKRSRPYSQNEQSDDSSKRFIDNQSRVTKKNKKRTSKKPKQRRKRLSLTKQSKPKRKALIKPSASLLQRSIERMNGSITVPLSKSDSLVVKLKEGFNVFLGGTPNKLAINSEGQVVEEKTIILQTAVSTRMAQNQHMLSLQALAQEITRSLLKINSEERSEMMNESKEKWTNGDCSVNKNDYLNEADSRQG